ncbi:hypothetical protein Ctob_014867, partial [Chrysochromulina tobinii]
MPRVAQWPSHRAPSVGTQMKARRGPMSMSTLAARSAPGQRPSPVSLALSQLA